VSAAVAPEHRRIVASLTQLYNSCAPLATNPARRREMDDTSKRVGALLWKLNRHEVSARVASQLLAMCDAIDAGDWGAAAQRQVELTTSDWDEAGAWLTALKRLVKARQTGQ